jgi:tRNA pseudouridine55 synthase
VTAPTRDGLLLVDKPSGPTSHDVVDRVRRASGVRRVGHAGTLDPMARGLLPLVLGRATRLVRFLPDSPKTYEGSLRLGRTTTTDDETGDVLAEHEGPLPSAAQVLAASRGLEGRQSQVPPAFSARRVEGRRLYDLARRGLTVTARPTEVEVGRFELAPTGRPDVYEFAAEVSAGTYIRALARDLGRDLGCGGLLLSLVRTGIGPMRLADARGWPDGGPDRSWVLDGLLPLERMPLGPPPLRLARADEARRFTLGGIVRVGRDPGVRRLVRVMDDRDALLGIGEIVEDGLHPRVVVARADDPTP